MSKKINQRHALSIICILLSCISPIKVTAQELLWCSGTRASSPLCIEFNEALAARSEAKLLKDSIEKVAERPFSKNDFDNALQTYNDAKSLFNDEYFGDSTIKFNESIASMQRIKTSFMTEVKKLQMLVQEVGITRNFRQVLDAINTLEMLTKKDLSDDKARVNGMQSGWKSLQKVQSTLDNKDFRTAQKLFDSINPSDISIFKKEIQETKRIIDQMTRQSVFSELVSSAFEELDNGKYTSAQKKLLAAKQLNNQSTVVIEALQEIDLRKNLVRIRNLKKNLATSLENENFIAAKAAIDSLLVDDPTFLDGGRSELYSKYIRIDKELDVLLYQLKSLSYVKIRNKINSLFTDIDDEEIINYGSKITAKYVSLKNQFLKLSKKVRVELISDGQTPVIISPGGRLGKFKNIVINIYSGNYSITVRCVGRKESVRQVEITASRPNQLIDLTCQS